MSESLGQIQETKSRLKIPHPELTDCGGRQRHTHIILTSAAAQVCRGAWGGRWGQRRVLSNAWRARKPFHGRRFRADP